MNQVRIVWDDGFAIRVRGDFLDAEQMADKLGAEKVVDGGDIYARIDGQWKMIQEAKR